MELETGRFGRLSISEDEILRFRPGIIGFERLERYVLLEDPKRKPFRFLQSVDDPDLAFVLIDPRWFRPDYRVVVPPATLPDEGIRPEEVDVYAIVTVPPDRAQMTANLRAPVLLHRKTGWGTQLVLADTPYGTRHNIITELRWLAQQSERGGGGARRLQAAPGA